MVENIERVFIPFPAWEGMRIVDELAAIISGLRPEVKIPYGHARHIDVKHLPNQGADGHIEVSYWFPTQGRVYLEMVGNHDYRQNMTFWTAVGLHALWKVPIDETKEIEFGEKEVELLNRLNDLQRTEKQSDLLMAINNKAKRVISKVSIKDAY